jgi:hypothetical protein
VQQFQTLCRQLPDIIQSFIAFARDLQSHDARPCFSIRYFICLKFSPSLHGWFCFFTLSFSSLKIHFIISKAGKALVWASFFFFGPG